MSPSLCPHCCAEICLQTSHDIKRCSADAIDTGMASMTWKQLVTFGYKSTWSLIGSRQCNRTLLLLLHISLSKAEFRVEMTTNLTNHLQWIYHVRLSWKQILSFKSCHRTEQDRPAVLQGDEWEIHVSFPVFWCRLCMDIWSVLLSSLSVGTSPPREVFYFSSR